MSSEIIATNFTQIGVLSLIARLGMAEQMKVTKITNRSMFIIYVDIQND